MNNISNPDSTEHNQDAREATSKHPFIERNSCRPFDLANNEHKMVHELIAECWKQAGQKGPTPELYFLADGRPDLIRLGCEGGQSAFVLTSGLMQMIVGEVSVQMALRNYHVQALLEELCRHSITEDGVRSVMNLEHRLAGGVWSEL